MTLFNQLGRFADGVYKNVGRVGRKVKHWWRPIQPYRKTRWSVNAIFTIFFFFHLHRLNEQAHDGTLHYLYLALAYALTMIYLFLHFLLPAERAMTIEERAQKLGDNEYRPYERILCEYGFSLVFMFMSVTYNIMIFIPYLDVATQERNLYLIYLIIAFYACFTGIIVLAMACFFGNPFADTVFQKWCCIQGKLSHRNRPVKGKMIVTKKKTHSTHLQSTQTILHQHQTRTLKRNAKPKVETTSRVYTPDYD